MALTANAASSYKLPLTISTMICCLLGRLEFRKVSVKNNYVRARNESHVNSDGLAGASESSRRGLVRESGNQCYDLPWPARCQNDSVIDIPIAETWKAIKPAIWRHEPPDGHYLDPTRGLVEKISLPES